MVIDKVETLIIPHQDRTMNFRINGETLCKTVRQMLWDNTKFNQEETNDKILIYFDGTQGRSILNIEQLVSRLKNNYFYFLSVWQPLHSQTRPLQRVRHDHVIEEGSVLLPDLVLLVDESFLHSAVVCLSHLLKKSTIPTKIKFIGKFA